MKDHNEIQDLYLKGKLDSYLYDVQLFEGENPITKGTGRLYNNADGRLALELFVPTKEVVEILFKPLSERGEYTPIEKILRCAGKFDGRWEFTAHNITRPEGSADLSGYAILRFYPSNIKLFQRSHSDNRKLLIEGFCPALTYWRPTLISEISDSNPILGKSQHSQDYSLLETDGSTIILRKESDSLTKVQIQIVETRFNLEQLSNAFLDAISFIEGKHIKWLCYRLSNGKDTHEIFLNQPQNKQRPFYPPVPISAVPYQVQTLLSQAIQYIYIPSNHGIVDGLSFCWESPQIEFTSGALLICVAVETIVKFLDKIIKIKVKESEKSEFTNLQIQLSEVISNTSPFKESGLSSRLKAIVSSASYHRVEDQIRYLSKELNLGVSESEIIAWKKLRTKLAHGNIPFAQTPYEQARTLLNQRTLTANMINKLVLGAFMYNGTFINYSDPKWSPAEFPPRSIENENASTTTDTQTPSN